jgi:tetratricopeptide (TPR) repeat protein
MKYANSPTSVWNSSFTRRVLPILALGLLVILFYIPALRGGYVWDDADAVAENPYNHSLRGLWIIWSKPAYIPLGHYWPLTFTSFWIEYQLWGDNPFGYHLINVLLHAANAILVWILLRRMVGIRPAGAWLAAAFFALHPMQVESVAWVIEQKTLLAVLFYLLSALAYGRFVRDRPWRFYVLSLALFVCAMLSKTIAVTLPIALGLWHWYRRDRLNSRVLVGLLPFLFVGAGIAALHVYFFLRSQPVSILPLVNRLLIAGQGIWFYIGKLLWPHPLMTIYPRWDINPYSFGQWAYLVAFLSALVGLWALRHRIRRAPLAAVLFFVISLAPVLNLIDQPYFTAMSFVNDHAVYLPSLGLFALVGAGVVRLFRADRLLRSVVVISVCVLLISAMGVLTSKQASLYKDMETLFADAVKKNPQAATAHYNLARALIGRGEINRALHHYQMASHLNPNDSLARIGQGVCLLHLGDTAGAETQWRAALEIDKDSPGAHVNLAVLCIQEQHWDEAIAHCEAALRRRPAFADAHINLGTALFGKGQVEQAASHFQRALVLNPDLPNAHVNLAKAMAALGHREKAITHLQKAIELDPEDVEARLDLSKLLRAVGRTRDAATQLEQALRFRPQDPILHYRIGVLYSELNDPKAAQSHLRQALRLRPGWIEALTNLAWILATSKDASVRNGEEAVRLAQQANALSGGHHPVILDTLAAAYAEAGEFEQACATAEQALELSRNTQPPDWISAAQQRLEQYRSNQPHRD